MIFICKFIILLTTFRIKLLKNKRKHKKRRRKWINGHDGVKKEKKRKKEKEMGITQLLLLKSM